MIADWKTFKLVFFNLFLNAVKYNKNNGYIIIAIKIEDCEEFQLNLNEEEEREMKIQKYLSTEIIDSGIGIEQERQKFLFKPFGELYHTQSITKVKDHSIGLGLACSQILTQQIKGKIELVQSNPDKTTFRFKIPVKLYSATEES